MTSIIRRDPRPAAGIFDWLDEAFPTLLMRPAAPFPAATASGRMRVEDYMDGTDYVVRAELPGVDPSKDVEIRVEDGALVIKAERKDEQRDGRRSEFHYGVMFRTVTLPAGADEERIRAEYADGVLTVRVPVQVRTAEAKRIPVQRAGERAEAQAQMS